MSITIELMRSTGPIVSVKPAASSSLVKKLMGEEQATLLFELNALYNFKVGDYATILGETYILSQPPEITKKSRYNYEYTLLMETAQHRLRNAQYLFYNYRNEIAEPDFALTGTADDFMNLLVLNANRIGMSWVKGGVVASEYKTLSFAKEDCYSALTKIAEAFETEFYISGAMIHLAKKERLTSHTFMYGKETGLYKITRSVADTEMFTRLYVYGGNQNLPNTYRNFSPRLLMRSQSECLITDLNCTVTDHPLVLEKTYAFQYVPPTSDSVTGVTVERHIVGSPDPWDTEATSGEGSYSITLPYGVYEFRFRSVGGPCDNQVTPAQTITETTPQLLLQTASMIEKNVGLYGVLEGALVVEDIYPNREGVVSAVDLGDFYKFKDTSLDFDINDHLLPGISAKIVFNSGQLAGYRFEIKKYDAATKEFTILKNKDEKAIDVPSNLFRPAIGDKYILTDILLPQAYVDQAEAKLREKAVTFLDSKSVPNYKYTVDCDPTFFRQMGISLETGDVVRLIDTELAVDQSMRIVSLTRSLVDEFQYEIELGEAIPPGAIESLRLAQINNSSQTQRTASAFNNNPLLNGVHIGTLKIEQGTINVKDMETAVSTAGMQQLYIDGNGKIWKAP